LGSKSGDGWGGGIGSCRVTGSRGCGVGRTVMDGWGSCGSWLGLRSELVGQGKEVPVTVNDAADCCTSEALRPEAQSKVS